MPGNKSAMQLGMEIQHDPYKHLLSQREKQSARNLPFRFFFNGISAAGAAIYYMSRHNEIARLKSLRISVDLLFGVTWRVALTVVVADQVSRRMFVNYLALRKHKMAEYELKKTMRMWPGAKPMTAPHQRPNSYFWC